MSDGLRGVCFWVCLAVGLGWENDDKDGVGRSGGMDMDYGYGYGYGFTAWRFTEASASDTIMPLFPPSDAWFWSCYCYAIYLLPCFDVLFYSVH